MTQLPQLPGGLAAALLLAVGCLPSCLASATPSVNVALNAAFPSPPYLVELVETAAQENGTSFFPLLDRVSEGAFSGAKTDKELYEQFLQVLQQDGHITHPEALSTFKLALSLRSAAPRIEAHYQYYNTAVEPSLPTNQDGCETWFLSGDKQYCDPAMATERGAVGVTLQNRLVGFDRTYGSSNAQDTILYADLTSPTFASYHKAAMDLARRGGASYRLRYKRTPTQGSEPLPVSGYGVQLALKKTDYIVIDDRESGVEAGEEAQKVVASSETVLDDEEEIADLKPLEKSDLSSLGMKAASFIMQSDSPFETTLKLTQDFPKYSSSIAAHNVSADFEAEHQGNRRTMVPPGVNVLWMNGVQLIDRQIQPFTLVDMLRRERKLINGVLDLGLTGQEAVSLLGHTAVAAAKADDEPRRFDWRDDIEEGQVIIWLNNIERDKRYETFHPSLTALLHPTLPGQLPQIRRDMFNLVVPLDFSMLSEVQLVVDQLLTLVKRSLPIRFGLVPLTPTGEAIEQAKIAYHIVETYGLGALVKYLEHWVENQKTPKANAAVFDAAIEDRKVRPEATPLPFSDIATSEHHEKQIHLAKHWAQRLNAETAVPPAFFDGIAIPREPGWLQAMQQRLMLDLRSIQEGLFYGAIDDNIWVPSRFLANAVSRRNVYIFPEEDESLAVVNINKIYTEHHDLLSQVPTIEANKASARDDWATLSIVVNLDSLDGQKLLFYALQFHRNNTGVRLDIIHNPAAESSTSPSLVNSRIVKQADALPNIQKLFDLEAILQPSDSEAEDPIFDTTLPAFLSTLNARPGDNLLVLNGRVIGPVVSAESFKTEDFQQFLDSERAMRILPVYKAIDDLGLDDKVSGPLAAAKLTSITALSTISDLPEGIFESAPSLRIAAFKIWSSTHTSFEVGDASTATIHLVAVLNPASELGQKWAPILKVLSELDGVYLRVFLNPQSDLSELPVKRFFRYVLDSAPIFDDAGKVKAPSATFAGIPSEALLTAGMDVPPAWLVSSKVAVDDLDNLKLKEIKSRRNVDKIEAVYELENILVEGHSRQVPSGSAPRGAQLVLAAENDSHFADTIIMANLGYFQFKANPGVYSIHLEEGRSSDIFSIESIGASGWNPVPGDESSEVILMDFQGTTLYPRLRRNPGMELEDVLEDSAPTGSSGGGARDFVSKGLKFAEGILGGSGSAVAKSKSETEHAEINIFSVASGHLYERMLNIMMVSVMRHTNHTVKFWFIEQFLSPSFKDFIPTMAAEYGFKYEMVTFKWPHWLRQQKEKQREIWGYKILFLDVLFPLSLYKVIFVDADQIVRTDMYDLVQLDLDGAPYGFTPMCDSRVEMEGFRFWKQGYWDKYLRGLPYHISALYVVDLRRFRDLAAGDRLRQQYHALSADPNSLANLDQDLPNHMQFNIPIHSLPQEWLWCETWCSDDTLKDARTIDLCNNPQTKEPKLDRARRQVPEWTEYDDEIAALDRRRRVAAKAGEGTVGEDGEASQKVLNQEKQPQEGGPTPEPVSSSRTSDDGEGVKTVHTKDEL